MINVSVNFVRKDSLKDHKAYVIVKYVTLQALSKTNLH